jgi:hypothetical protein
VPQSVGNNVRISGSDGRHNAPGSSWLASARCDVMARAPAAAPTAPAAARESALEDNTRKSMSEEGN